MFSKCDAFLRSVETLSVSLQIHLQLVFTSSSCVGIKLFMVFFFFYHHFNCEFCIKKVKKSKETKNNMM